MRRWVQRRAAARVRSFAVAVPWQSSLPAPSDALWEDVGRAVIETTQQMDSGLEAFEECLAVRRQLDEIVKGSGFEDMNVAIFGGMVSNRLLETGGDVDFVAVAPCELEFEQASSVVSKLGREMRRLGLRASAIPRARVPVVKVDRVSSALPGTPLHSMATSAVFQLIAPATPQQQAEFDDLLRREYDVVNVEWSRGQQLATATFPNSETTIRAIANVQRAGSIPIPLRLPLEPKLGPEVYRFPFDLCLQSSGLQNSHLIANALDTWVYSRHLMLLAKRWGRSSGVINSFDGLLASYGLTVLVVHFLVRVGKLAPLKVDQSLDPQLLPLAPTYQALDGPKAGDSAELGYLTAAFFEYYGSVFNYEEDVASTTTKVLKKPTLRWANRPSPDGVPRPPHYHLCIKDPYNTDNIGRNLNGGAAAYVGEAFQLADRHVKQEISDPSFMVSLLTSSTPRPAADADNAHAPVKLSSQRGWASPGSASAGAAQAPGASGSSGGAAATPGGRAAGGEGDMAMEDVQDDARRLLKKMEFDARKASIQRIGDATVRRNNQVRAAQDLTRSIVEWIRGREKETRSTQ